MKLYIDPGHGGSDPGAIGNGLKEKDITLDIAKRLREILLVRYKQVDIRLSRTKDETVSLWQRTNDANNWGADYFVSIHCNAFNGRVSGYEDFIYNGLSSYSETARFQKKLHEEIVKRVGLNNRGREKANFHVLRETKMPAFLSENGFIDHKKDAKLMRHASWREKIAEGHAIGIAKAFKLERKENNIERYEVIAGSFQKRDNAEKRLAYLKSNGFTSIITPAQFEKGQFYRVRSGSFLNKQEAEQQVRLIEQIGIDAFILKSNQ